MLWDEMRCTWLNSDIKFYIESHAYIPTLYSFEGMGGVISLHGQSTIVSVIWFFQEAISIDPFVLEPRRSGYFVWKDIEHSAVDTGNSIDRRPWEVKTTY